MKKTLRSLVMTALLLSAAQACSAKDKAPAAAGEADGRKPVIVISIAGYDNVMDDVGYIGRLAQMPELEKLAEGIIASQTKAKGLEGLDTKRPWGVVVNTDGFGFQPIGFLPVTDLDKLLDAASGLIGPAEQKPNGILELSQKNPRVYLKEKNGWVFIAQSPENLSNLPADPLPWLSGLDKQYQIGLKFYIHNIPDAFRSLAIDYLKNVSQTLPSDEDEDEATAEKRKEFMDKQAKSMAELINTVDQFTLGWALDTKGNTSHLDTTLTALPNSTLAKKLNALKDTTSNYTGFMLPKAAVVLNSSQTLLVDDIEQAAQGIDAFQATLSREIENSPDLTDDDSRAAAKRIVAEAADAIKATIKTGKVDFGGSWLLGDRRFTLIAGAYISEPAELEKALKDLVAVAAKDPTFPAVKFDVATHGDVRFHTWTSPVPAVDTVNRAIGKELKVAVGFGPQSVYFGVGTDDPLVLIKKAIDASKTATSGKVPPGVVDVALQPILEFASVLKPDDEKLAAVLTEVAKTPGKDHVHLEIKPQENGVSYRLELQEGVLKALGLAAKAQMDKQSGQ
ncbi:MAG TPA: hypothetical protein VHY91_07320 [Pirellulales bacterium]|nr:hypothetical protein [Pirellulales bacterium]